MYPGPCHDHPMHFRPNENSTPPPLSGSDANHCLRTAPVCAGVRREAMLCAAQPRDIRRVGWMSFLFLHKGSCAKVMHRLQGWIPQNEETSESPRFSPTTDPHDQPKGWPRLPGPTQRPPPAVPRSPTPCRTGDATSRRFPKGRVRSVMKRDANGPNVKDFTVHLNHFSTRRGCSQVFCVAPTDFVWERPSYCERTHYKRVPVQVLRSHPLW